MKCFAGDFACRIVGAIMRTKRILPSTVVITFEPTADGLVLNQISLHPANAAAERDLRKFLERFRDPVIDLERRAVWERMNPDA